jgi:hypothetical protein
MSEIISKDKVSARPGTATLQVAGQISFTAATASLVLLAALHVLSPEFDPALRMVSEYALGNFGRVLTLMFLAWALSCVALFFAIKSDVLTIGGKIGLVFLLAAAVGMSMAAMFDVNHNLHGLAAMIGIPSLPVAAILISVSLSHNPSWTPVRRSLLWTGILTWASLVLMTVAVFTGMSATGEASPDAWFGWANRLLVIAYNVWLMVVARRAVKIT